MQRVGEQALNIEGELVRDKKEEVLGLPLSSRKDQNVSCNLESRFERDQSLSPKPQKKSSREPSPVSPVQTKSRKRPNMGARLGSTGRRYASQVRQDETRRCVVDGR